MNTELNKPINNSTSSTQSPPPRTTCTTDNIDHNDKGPAPPNAKRQNDAQKQNLKDDLKQSENYNRQVNDFHKFEGTENSSDLEITQYRGDKKEHQISQHSPISKDLKIEGPKGTVDLKRDVSVRSSKVARSSKDYYQEDYLTDDEEKLIYSDEEDCTINSSGTKLGASSSLQPSSVSQAPHSGSFSHEKNNTSSANTTPTVSTVPKNQPSGTSTTSKTKGITSTVQPVTSGSAIINGSLSDSLNQASKQQLSNKTWVQQQQPNKQQPPQTTGIAATAVGGSDKQREEEQKQQFTEDEEEQFYDEEEDDYFDEHDDDEDDPSYAGLERFGKEKRGSVSRSPSGSPAPSAHASAGSDSNDNKKSSIRGLPANLPAHLLRAISVSGATLASASSAATADDTPQQSSEDYARNWLKQRQKQQQQQVKEDDQESEKRLAQQQTQEELIRQVKLQQQEKEKEETQKKSISTNELLLKYSGITLSNAAGESLLSEHKANKSLSVSSVSVSGLPKSVSSSITFSKAGPASDEEELEGEEEEEDYFSDDDLLPPEQYSAGESKAGSSVSLVGTTIGFAKSLGCSISFASATADSRNHPFKSLPGSSITIAGAEKSSPDISKSFGGSISLTNRPSQAASSSRSLTGSSISITNAKSVADLPASISRSITFSKKPVSSTEELSTSRTQTPSDEEKSSDSTNYSLSALAGKNITLSNLNDTVTGSGPTGARVSPVSVSYSESSSSGFQLPTGITTSVITSSAAITAAEAPVSSATSSGAGGSSSIQPPLVPTSSHHRCLECGAVFENGTKLRQHIFSSHSARSRSITPPAGTPAKFTPIVRCSICHIPFSSTFLLQQHRISVHSQTKQPIDTGVKEINLTESKDSTSVVKPRPFKLFQRCRKCAIKRFPNYKLFEEHHLVHIRAVRALVKIDKGSCDKLLLLPQTIVESAKDKKPAVGKKRGRKPGPKNKRSSTYDDDKDYFAGNLKLKLKLTVPREGSGRIKRRVSILNSGMSALLEDSDGEAFEGDFEELPDIPSLRPPDTSQGENSSEKDNNSQEAETEQHTKESAEDQYTENEGQKQYSEQEKGIDQNEEGHQFDDQSEQHQQQQPPTPMTADQMSASDEGYDDDPDDPDGVNGGNEQEQQSEQLTEANSENGGHDREQAEENETTFREVDQAEHREKSRGGEEQNNQFDNAFNNPANLSFDSESENERPPSTYQPQFESFTGDWFQEYESGPRIAAAMAGSSVEEGQHEGEGDWSEASHGSEPTREKETSSHPEDTNTQESTPNDGDQSGLFSQQVLGNENNTSTSEGQSGGSFEQLCLNDSFNQDQTESRSDSQESSREGQGENGPRDLLSELEYLNRGGQSSNDVGQNSENSEESGLHSQQLSTSRPGSNSSGQSGGHPTPPPDTSFRALATSPLTSPTSPSIAVGAAVTTSSPLMGVPSAQSTSPHLASSSSSSSHMVGSPLMAGSAHMTSSPHHMSGSPHLAGSPQMTGSPQQMLGSPHQMTGSPQMAGSPLSQSQQSSAQQPTEARLTIANNLMASSSTNGNLPPTTNLLANTYQQWPAVATTSSYSTSFLGSNGLGAGSSMRPPMPPGVSVPYRHSPPPRVRGRPPLMGHTRPPVMRGPGRPSGSSILPPPLMPAPGGRGMPSLQRLPGYNNQQRQMQQQMPGQKRPLPGGQQSTMSPNKSQKREDINVPSRQKDTECQIIAVANRSDGLPVISNVQGGREERRTTTNTNSGAAPASSESTIHLSDSITLSVRSSGANKESARNERTGDAGTVANLLASRGITVTPAAGEKNNDGGGREERRIPTASDLNLSSAISVHPPTSRDRDGFAVPQAPTSRSSSSSSRDVERPPRPPTVDLTHDISPSGAQTNRVKCSQCDRSFPNQSLLADHAKVHQQAQSSRMPYKCHLCTAGFSTQKGQQHHYQQFHQLHLSTNDVAIPVVDLRNPVNVQRMAALGVRSFLPLTNLQNRGGGGIVGIPLLTLENLRNGQMTLQQWGVSDVLTLGPAKTLNMPR